MMEPIEAMDADAAPPAMGSLLWRAEGLTRLYPLLEDLAGVHGDLAQMFRVLAVHLTHGNLMVALGDPDVVREVAGLFFETETADRYATWLVRATRDAVELCLTEG
jgi:hypothetical protein